MTCYQIKKYILAIAIIILLFIALIIAQVKSSNIDAKRQKAAIQLFQTYITAYINSYLICPPANSINITDKLHQGFLWYLQKANVGEPYAQFVVGNAYLKGIGVNPNFDIALTWILKAANQNISAAQFTYATLLLGDKRLKMSQPEKQILLQEALVWFKKASQHKDIFGQFSLAMYYLYTQDYEKYYLLIKKLAYQRHPVAQQILADIYSNGIGTPENVIIAIYWYKKSINNHPTILLNDDSMANLSLIYADEPFRDKSKSEYWSAKQMQFEAKMNCKRN